MDFINKTISKKLDLGSYFKNVKKTSPLIHNITNYVTVNDCANILLACGASPIMSDDIEDALEITSICSGLNINIGTLNQRTIPTMYACGKKSNELKHPVLLDPVGVGASMLRTNTANGLLKEIQFSIVRGNISEIKTLALGTGQTKGVDASNFDRVTENNLDEVIYFIKDFAKRINSIIVVTGAIDIITDSLKTYIVYNGHKMMSSITGTGCQLSAMITAFIAANPNSILEASVAAVCAIGYCGEKAFSRLKKEDGNSTYRNYIIDSVYNLTADELNDGGKYELR